MGKPLLHRKVFKKTNQLRKTLNFSCNFRTWPQVSSSTGNVKIAVILKCNITLVYGGIKRSNLKCSLLQRKIA